MFIFGEDHQMLVMFLTTSTATLLNYVSEWEALRGKTMPKSTQSLLTASKVAKFAEEFIQGKPVKYEDFGISTQSLHKYLPMFGLSFDDVRRDKHALATPERIVKAILEYLEGGKIEVICESNNVSSTTLYKYIKENSISLRK